MKLTTTVLLGISLLPALPVSRGFAAETNPAAPVSAQTVPGKELTVENTTCLLSYDPAKGKFSIRHKPSGRMFVKNGSFEERGGKASLTTVKNKYLGAGKGIEILYPNGNRDTMALYEGLPFVVFDSTRHNATAEAQVLNRVSLFSAQVDVGTDLKNVKTLGTVGLRPPAGNPGSYAFLAVADPATRSGVVGGWLTHDRGSGVVFSPVVDGSVRMQARLDFGRLRIKPGADSGLETFVLGWFEDARFGLETYADAIAKVYGVKLPAKMAGLCTWYMQKHGGACDETHLPEISAVAAKELKPFGFDFIMIDDGWQAGIKDNGDAKNFTTHAPDKGYPSGMKAAQENISKFGLIPSIWFIPFAGNYKDPFFKDHQDWFVKTAEGKPYDTVWGGTCLDMTNPDAQAFVKSNVQRIAREWGYNKLFKLDGYWTGSATKLNYVNEGYHEDGMGDAVFFNPDKTNIEALRDGTRLVRETAGPGVFLLGCAMTQNMRTFGGTFGLLDAMRVGPDTAGEIGSPWGTRNWFLNGRVWWNDPDCVYVRKEVSLDRARLNASWTTIADQLFYISDWLPESPADRMDIIKRCMPAHGLPSRPVDVFESDIAKIWLLTDTRDKARRDVVGFYNWGKQPEEISATTQKIGLPPAEEYVGFDFWANKFVPPFREQITATLPPKSCRILAVRPASSVPQLVSTSRHVTQGIVDVTGENWEGQKAVLGGVSKVVANDPYELRIVVPVGAKSWRPVGVKLSPADEAAGVKASFVHDGPKVRATLTSAESREVKWGVQFEPAEVQIAMPSAVKQLKAAADYSGVTVSWAADATDSYRVQRNDGVVFETNANSIKDPAIKRGTSYQYQVIALGWGSKASAPSMVEITPMMPECPPAPPAPTVRLDDLKPIQAKSGAGTPTPGKAISGNPLRINGKTYKNGIGTHAPGLLVYSVPAGATRFVAVLGLDDAVKNDKRASVVFQVFGDVKEMGEKPVLIAESPMLSPHTIGSWVFNLELNSRFKELRLVVTDADDGRMCDHADWVDAGFITGPKNP